MRVLHLDSGREMRGGQWQVLALLKELGPGHTLFAAGDGPLMQKAQAEGIAVQPLSLAAIHSFSKTVDIVHAHDARSHTWAATLCSAPIVVSRRVAFPVKQTFLSRWKYRRAQHFLAVSNHVRETLMEAGVPGDKISVVYDGVTLNKQVASGATVMALETADPMKGSDLVARAAEIARINVHFSSNLDHDLLSAGLFVYITRSEGLGSAALRALAAGVPVVASRVGGLPEVVEDGVNGALTANEPEAIASAITRAFQVRVRLAANAQPSVSERFSLAKMVERTRLVYEQVAS
jgi:glycosyltransferase involved in cell wall biosynthesis